ncbi:unnamed protein product [Mesocestoides corti]|uniref:Uncharacterized protein n=1 Tax=Mesocestoides corti TaxID=53468 RepID=A0A0R3URV0_MESCO|nr:unnamed protein product [Mesocestoides corti]
MFFRLDMELTVALDGDPLAKQSVMLDSVVSGEERSIAQVPKRKMTYRGRRGTRSSGGGNESVMRVDFGGVAQQKSCTPVDAEAPTKKPCRVSEGDKSETGEGIGVEEEGGGVGEGG